MKSIFIIGGLGDIVHTIFAASKYTEKYQIKFDNLICSDLQFDTIKEILKILSPFVYVDYEIIIVDSVKFENLKSELREISSYNPTGPIITLRNDLKNIFMFWPGYSSDMANISENSECWPDVYSNYSDIDSFENYFYFEADNYINAKSVFVSLNANSIEIDSCLIMNQLNTFLHKCTNVVNLYIHKSKNLRPDLKSKPNSEFNIAVRDGINVIEFGDDFKSMIKLLSNKIEYAFLLRSGLVELVNLLRIPCSVIYPNVHDYEFYKLTKLEQDSVHNIVC